MVRRATKKPTKSKTYKTQNPAYLQFPRGWWDRIGTKNQNNSFLILVKFL